MGRGYFTLSLFGMRRGDWPAAQSHSPHFGEERDAIGPRLDPETDEREIGRAKAGAQ